MEFHLTCLGTKDIHSSTGLWHCIKKMATTLFWSYFIIENTSHFVVKNDFDISKENF
jgi:hypothetical protein